LKRRRDTWPAREIWNESKRERDYSLGGASIWPNQNTDRDDDFHPETAAARYRRENKIKMIAPNWPRAVENCRGARAIIVVLSYCVRGQN